MPKYNIVLTLQLLLCKEGSDRKYHEYYLQISKEIELPFHPNITDKIYIEEAYWKIEEIAIDVDDSIFTIKCHQPCLGMVASDSEYKNRKLLVSEYENNLKQNEWVLDDWSLGEKSISYDEILKDMIRKKELLTTAKEEEK